ncbi:hypothetical protein TSUD_178160 [Trifolium subterraneum]|uniref:Uncharacterized protein n=1 Tax=Trifolium subterraneum TaxID=3900 RepID=A0A2Z6MM05_TRISU|nr:hypothetical protein TSUD_178160 [Trifolium subterraneum]
MAVSSFHRVFTFECRSDPYFSSLPSTKNLRNNRRHFPVVALSVAFYATSVSHKSSLLRGLMNAPDWRRDTVKRDGETDGGEMMTVVADIFGGWKGREIEIRTTFEGENAVET